jgi:hypothetical protein
MNERPVNLATFEIVCFALAVACVVWMPSFELEWIRASYFASWSIWQLGMLSFLLSGTLIAIWQKCISLFHNLRT